MMILRLLKVKWISTDLFSPILSVLFSISYFVPLYSRIQNVNVIFWIVFVLSFVSASTEILVMRLSFLLHSIELKYHYVDLVALFSIWCACSLFQVLMGNTSTEREGRNTTNKLSNAKINENEREWGKWQP